jgi:acyl-CoA thioesterase II
VSEPNDPSLDVLIAILDLEEIDRDIFRGTTPPAPLQRVFGGQVAAQALVAAQRTVPGRAVHSLHAYFVRPGAPDRPIVYEVDRVRDGRSYTTRRVLGIQDGKAIFNLQASFQVVEDGYEHQTPFPAVADPETLPRWRPWADAKEFDLTNGLLPYMPFELRLAPPGGGYERMFWIRTVRRLADDPMLHRCVAAYASDLTLLGVAVPGAASGDDRPPTRPSFMASLDHAMWFHRPFRVDEWLLYAQSWVSSSGGRGLAEGRLFCADGRLAFSVVQEGVIRADRVASA